MKPNHMIACAVLLVAGIALFASGNGGLYLLPLLLCMAMMGGMMFFMMGGNSGKRDK